jgi:hypothetical protein
MVWTNGWEMGPLEPPAPQATLEENHKRELSMFQPNTPIFKTVVYVIARVDDSKLLRVVEPVGRAKELTDHQRDR